VRNHTIHTIAINTKAMWRMKHLSDDLKVEINVFNVQWNGILKALRIRAANGY
jgi:hypothetical protein